MLKQRCAKKLGGRRRVFGQKRKIQFRRMSSAEMQQYFGGTSYPLIPAHAGIQNELLAAWLWIPACAGMSGVCWKCLSHSHGRACLPRRSSRSERRRVPPAGRSMIGCSAPRPLRRAKARPYASCLLQRFKDVDARDRRGHDRGEAVRFKNSRSHSGTARKRWTRNPETKRSGCIWIPGSQLSAAPRNDGGGPCAPE